MQSVVIHNIKKSREERGERKLHSIASFTSSPPKGNISLSWWGKNKSKKKRRMARREPSLLKKIKDCTKENYSKLRYKSKANKNGDREGENV